MKKFSLITSVLLLAGLSSCTQVNKIPTGKVVTAEELSANLVVESLTPGSNRVHLKNNNPGIGGMWDYNAGVSTLSELTVDIPFLGEQVIKFYATCDTEIVEVEKPINITTIDYPADPMYVKLAGEGVAGKTWYWNTNMQNGCYGAGGYGWSPLYPDWNATSSGKGDWSDVEVFPQEYIVFDLNKSANVRLYKADGSVVTGFFNCSTGTSPEKEAVGWVGKLTLRGSGTALPLPSPFTYYGGSPVENEFEIAKITDTELVLIQGDKDQNCIFCDPDWASASTHWCFISAPSN